MIVILTQGVWVNVEKVSEKLIENISQKPTTVSVKLKFYFCASGFRRTGCGPDRQVRGQHSERLRHFHLDHPVLRPLLSPPQRPRTRQPLHHGNGPCYSGNFHVRKFVSLQDQAWFKVLNLEMFKISLHETISQFTKSLNMLWYKYLSKNVKKLNITQKICFITKFHHDKKRS